MSLRARLRPFARRELQYLLELAGVCAIVVARPVLEVFSGSPDEFILAQASADEIVVFALLVTLVPPVGAWLVGLAGGLGGERARLFTHATTVGMLGGIFAAQVARELGVWAPARWAVGLIAAVAVAVGRARVETVGLWMRYLAVAPLVVLGLFLFASPVRPLVSKGETAELATSRVGNPAPVVIIVLDELPTASLLDGSGAIDADLFPNFAALADDATWYRNHTTVAPVTTQALPALVSGRLPDGENQAPTAANFDETLFTLLGGTYDVRATETLTRLCPTNLCEPKGAPSTARVLSELLYDAVELWGEVAVPGREPQPLDFDLGLPIDLAAPGRLSEFALSLRDSGRPSLDYLHVLLPHQPLSYFPSGEQYAATNPPDGVSFFIPGWWVDQATADLGRQRHLLQLQYTDALLGGVLEQLRALGTYDETLLVVTADHGISFIEGQPYRGVSEGNYHEILWTPLFVKAPDQTDGVVDDRAMSIVDIVPTIADILDVEIPWALDGRSALEPGDPGDPDVRVVDWGHSAVEPTDGFALLDRVRGFERVLDTEPLVAGTGDDLRLYRLGDYGDLVGTPVGEISAGDDVDFEIRLDRTDYEVVAGSNEVPAYISGEFADPVDENLVIAVNGVVGAVVPVHDFGDVGPFWALLPPSLFDEGTNDVDLYVVRGPPSAPTLHLLADA